MSRTSTTGVQRESAVSGGPVISWPSNDRAPHYYYPGAVFLADFFHGEDGRQAAAARAIGWSERQLDRFLRLVDCLRTAPEELHETSAEFSRSRSDRNGNHGLDEDDPD
jgi:hypothetical protein